jgi:hypothetical protein
VVDLYKSDVVLIATFHPNKFVNKNYKKKMLCDRLWTAENGFFFFFFFSPEKRLEIVSSGLINL